MKISYLLFLLIPLNTYSQDLTGTWVGRESGAAYLKLVIVQLGDSCIGYTYDEGPGFCKANFAGTFDPDSKKLKGKGTSFIERSPDHVLVAYHLNYRKDGEDEYLEGTSAAKGAGGVMLALGMHSYAELKKMTTEVDPTAFMMEKARLYFKENKFTGRLQPNLPNGLVTDKEQKALPDTIINLKRERFSKVVKTIYTNVDTVKLMLYDNGIVDDDTVTVFFDNAIILDRYRITEKAKALDITLIKDGQPHVVELFANNLGKIPPNTALIVIMAGSERYELHAAYDLSTNAKIIFQFQE